MDKVSEITVKDVAEYINLDMLDDADYKLLSTYLTTAKSYVKNYTGVKDLDEIPEFVIVVLILCSDMYDNRALITEKYTTVNPTVKTILNMHSRNLL